MKVYLHYEVPALDGPRCLNDMASESMMWRMELEKYKTMWQLRTLEEQIDDDGGMIIINDKGGVHLKHFRSQTLADKIQEILVANEE